MNGQNNKRHAEKALQIRKEIQQRPWLWAAVVLLALFTTVSMASGNSGGMIIFGFLVLITTALLVMSKLRRGNRVVHDWAIEESQKQRIASLSGTTTDELEEMVQYHLSKGHIQEADTISRRLMDMVDEPGATTATPVITEKDEGFVLQTSTGLPNWLSKDSGTSSTDSGSPNRSDKTPTAKPEEQGNESGGSLPNWLDKT